MALRTEVRDWPSAASLPTEAHREVVYVSEANDRATVVALGDGRWLILDEFCEEHGPLDLLGTVDLLGILLGGDT